MDRLESTLREMARECDEAASPSFALTIDDLRDTADACADHLRKAADEIERLQALCVYVHDRLLRGDSDRELMTALEAGWNVPSNAGNNRHEP